MIVRHREITESKRLRRCSLFAYNLYPMLIAWADDWGRAEWNERKIVAKYWPGHRAMLAGQIKKVLLEYARLGLIKAYVEGDVEYFEWQAPEFPLIPDGPRRRWMKCPPPRWAPEADHDRWARGCGKPRESRTLELPFEDLDSTSTRPLQSPPDTGHRLAGNPDALSVPSVPTTTEPPPHPPLTRGEAVALPAPSVPMEQALRLELGRRAREELRKAKEHVDHQILQARAFAVDNRIHLRPGSLRLFRKWFRSGASLAAVQRAIERGDHLVDRDGGAQHVEISKHLGQAELELLARAGKGKARPPP
jgi:hypothetical protein